MLPLIVDKRREKYFLQVERAQRRAWDALRAD